MGRPKIKCKYRVRMVALWWWVDLHDQQTGERVTSLGPFKKYFEADDKAKQTGWPDWDKERE